MQRSSIIATVVAAGGILIAGSVASVAVINAASSSQPESETIQLVSADSTGTPSPEATVDTSAGQAAPAAELPTMEASTLPELPEVAQPADQPQAVQAAPATTGKSSASKDSDDDSTPVRSAEPAATVSESQARSIVLKQGDGVSIVSTSKESHQGYRTWAVRFTRSNGEVLTGYVDRKSGVVVDWTVNQQAPAAQPTATASYEDDDEVDEVDEVDEPESDEYEDSDDD